MRNIPNKYNQAMLLEEVNARHEGTYDFFYLPIDFKNRCNVGYAFINFLDPHSIGPFVRDFDGQRWKSFNSEKVCAVSFARIQGKGAMVARFQNSSLLEKDDEYQPLLFYSSGPDRGKPEPFPSSSSGNGNINRPQHHSGQNQHGGKLGQLGHHAVNAPPHHNHHSHSQLLHQQQQQQHQHVSNVHHQQQQHHHQLYRNSTVSNGGTFQQSSSVQGDAGADAVDLAGHGGTY